MKNINACYNPGAFFTQAQWTREEFENGAPNNPRVEEFWYVWPVTLHEWCHYLQIVGTSFGNEYLETTMMSGSIISSLLKQIFQTHSIEVVSRPLLPHFIHLCADEKLAWNAIGVHNNFKILLGLQNEKNLLYNDWRPAPKRLPNPKVTIGTLDYYLGALQIMEGHARKNEEIYIKKKSGFSDSTLQTIQDKYNNKINLDPYNIAYKYFEQELPFAQVEDRDYLFCVCCDIALNPPSISSIREKSEDFEWEDYHPGWRFIRILRHLKHKINIYEPGNQDWLMEIQSELYDTFDWPSNAYQSSFQDSPMISPFAIHVNKTRSLEPLAFALPILFFRTLQKQFPVSFRDYYAPKDADVFFDDLLLNATTQFQAAREVGAIYEKTVHEILKSSKLTCPWHGTIFPPATKCVLNCRFSGFFSNIFGITLEEYCRIVINEEADKIITVK